MADLWAVVCLTLISDFGIINIYFWFKTVFSLGKNSVLIWHIDTFKGFNCCCFVCLVFLFFPAVVCS